MKNKIMGKNKKSRKKKVADDDFTDTDTTTKKPGIFKRIKNKINMTVKHCFVYQYLNKLTFFRHIADKTIQLAYRKHTIESIIPSMLN